MESQAQAEKTKGIKGIKNIYSFIKNVSWFISAYIALALFFLIKRFAFDLVRVNNKDMQSTYNYGDALLIKKSFNQYNTGDIIYFEYPSPDSVLTKTLMLQRLFGLPGDTFELRNKKVLINGMELLDTSSIRHNYFVKSVQKLDSNFKVTYNLTEGGEVSDEFDYSYSLTEEESQVLRAEPYIITVGIKTEKTKNFDETCFPGNKQFAWNMDHYGKIYIPRINDTLNLDTTSIKLFSVLITDYEKNDLQVKNDSIFINGNLTNYYVVKKNYYFVLGDNRDNANDSRVWGYLPENLIIGKVVRTVKKSK